VKCQTLKYTYVILSFSRAVIFLNLWFFFVTCDHEGPSFVSNMTSQILWEISKCVTFQTRNTIWSFFQWWNSWVPPKLMVFWVSSPLECWLMHFFGVFFWIFLCVYMAKLRVLVLCFSYFTDNYIILRCFKSKIKIKF
jgi:hypothetical protein